MPGGPPPLPAELHRKKGNPSKKKLPALATVTSLPAVAQDAPEHLGPQGTELWSHMRQQAPWIAESDRAGLLLLCEKWDRRADLLARLGSSDPVLYTDKGYAYANPLVGMLSTVENEIARLMSLLGLTPADRARLGVAEVKRASAIDQLLAKRQASRK